MIRNQDLVQEVKYYKTHIKHAGYFQGYLGHRLPWFQEVLSLQCFLVIGFVKEHRVSVEQHEQTAASHQVKPNERQLLSQSGATS